MSSMIIILPAMAVVTRRDQVQRKKLPCSVPVGSVVSSCSALCFYCSILFVVFIVWDVVDAVYGLIAVIIMICGQPFYFGLLNQCLLYLLPRAFNSFIYFYIGEKATNICLQLIPKNNNISVYHLEGGILAYLDEFADKKEESLFEGDCYVFDQRVAVSYGNKPSTIFQEKCHACRHPLSCDDIKRDDFVKGLSCKYCVGTISEKQREKFIQRQKQMELALENGKQHIYDPKEKKSLHCHKKVCVKRSDE